MVLEIIMVFERYGLRNGIVTLPGFDRDVSIGDSNYFRFDGLVKSIDEHTRELCQEFRLPNTFDDGSKLSGRTTTIGYRFFVGSIIYYKDMGEAHNIFTLGHESVETLMDYDMEQTLVKWLKEANFSVNGNISGIPRETFCDVGGLLALHLKGKHDEFVRQYPTRVDPRIIALMYQSRQRKN